MFGRHFTICSEFVWSEANYTSVGSCPNLTLGTNFECIYCCHHIPNADALSALSSAPQLNQEVEVSMFTEQFGGFVVQVKHYTSKDPVLSIVVCQEWPTRLDNSDLQLFWNRIF